MLKLYNVTLDSLVNFNGKQSNVVIPPKGKHFFGVTKMGERGQIVIPKKARDIFHIKPGDSLIFLGDELRGLAIVSEQMINNFLNLVKSPLNMEDDE